MMIGKDKALCLSMVVAGLLNFGSQGAKINPFVMTVKIDPFSSYILMLY